MPKRKIEENDWVTLQVPVTAVWDGEITVLLPNGNKATIPADSNEIIEVTKERVKPLFDRRD